jgi:hypothetical protein
MTNHSPAQLFPGMGLAHQFLFYLTRQQHVFACCKNATVVSHFFGRKVDPLKAEKTLAGDILM